MIRHICMFKLKEEGKEENLKKALKLADELLKPIDTLKKYEVVVNDSAAPQANYDLSLIFDYDSMEELQAYKIHPNHVKFGEFITSVREERACIDYKF